MKKALIGIIAALSIMAGPILAMGATTASAATPCKSITSVSERVLLFSSPTAQSASVGLSWTDNGGIFSRQVYKVEKIVNGGTPTLVSQSTSKSFTDSSPFGIEDDTVYRISTVGCDTAGVVFSYNAPDMPASGVYYSNHRIF